jgi:two-component system sensor histidine kinase MprB
VLNHGGLLRVEDTVSGGQPPGTSIYVLLPGRPLPASTYPTAGADTKANVMSDAKTDPAVPVANGANSRDSANVVSADSQSARAR